MTVLARYRADHMSAQTLSLDGVVLDRTTSGEHWTRLLVFSAEHGGVDCMQRRSRRSASTTPLLDLFDDVHLTLESSSQGKTWFVRDATCLRRRPGLGLSYEALRQACRFARVLARNPLHEESRAPVLALLHRALDAWETGVRPDATYFKSVYLLARDEGFPVREEWLQGLNTRDREAALILLQSPLSAQSISTSDVGRLSAALEAYLTSSTAMQFD